MTIDLYNYTPEEDFKQTDLIKLQDYTSDEIYQILSLGLALKSKHHSKIATPVLKGKTIALIFSKSSTRTRVSFEVGIHQLGGYGLFLSFHDIQLGRGEAIEDTAQVLSRYVDGIMIRTYKQDDVENLAKYASVPVINGLTDSFHPCQILADLMTIYEIKKTLSGLKLCYIGDGNNVANSLLIGCSKVGIDISIACPTGYEPDQNVVNMALLNSKNTGSNVSICSNPESAIKNADVVYSDVWTSMGQENETSSRLEKFAPFQVNKELFSLADSEAIFLHCLPAHRGEEVTSDVIDGPQSAVFDEAENRLHAQKAIMVMLMQDK
jgi:ornithine carbamoyltransferase